MSSMRYSLSILKYVFKANITFKTQHKFNYQQKYNCSSIDKIGTLEIICQVCKYIFNPHFFLQLI